LLTTKFVELAFALRVRLSFLVSEVNFIEMAFWMIGNLNLLYFTTELLMIPFNAIFTFLSCINLFWIFAIYFTCFTIAFNGILLNLFMFLV
jgi:hypothetical protein